ncbi:MAG: hypothetical protein A2096_07705 [Spirochaetes bacterium GWF1_41_5]|nr:MAG: hypothetical protein A2096_07705 [Spirochaetes bacterium GWF1_41_5]
MKRYTAFFFALQNIKKRKSIFFLSLLLETVYFCLIFSALFLYFYPAKEIAAAAHLRVFWVFSSVFYITALTVIRFTLHYSGAFNRALLNIFGFSGSYMLGISFYEALFTSVSGFIMALAAVLPAWHAGAGNFINIPSGTAGSLLLCARLLAAGIATFIFTLIGHLPDLMQIFKINIRLNQ